ncbi:hypothetical protein [Pyxidicoccus trucidator]|uniref:hypothetical protein n=1 Tax=Pyxidicoccus trucidator TaxID=2709662 RepID=UPI0013DA1ECF|nr:hypothetical protein [Pyxidicoccus trucidator]
MKTTKMKTIKELFVKDLARVQGGQGTTPTTPTTSSDTLTCNAQKPETTQACCEEANDNCCF